MSLAGSVNHKDSHVNISTHSLYDKPTKADIESVLKFLDPDMEWEDKLVVGKAIRSELGEAGYPLFKRWSAEGIKYAEDHEAKDVYYSDEYDYLPINIRALFNMAEDAGWRSNPRPIEKVVDTASPGFWDANSFSPLIAEQPKPVPQLVSGLIPVKGPIGVVGPPGSGKTMLMLSIGFATATGMPLLGNPAWTVDQGAALIIEAEDDRDEAQRRAHDLKQADPFLWKKLTYNSNRIFYWHPGGRDIRLTDRYGNETPMVQQLIEQIHDAPQIITALIIGPTININGGSEDNEGLYAVMRALLRIQNETGATPITFHHPPKSATLNTQRDQTAARGGGAFSGSVRAQIHIQNMGADEAKACGVPENERGRWVGISLPKANGIAPFESPVWLKRNPNSATMRWVPDQPQSMKKDKSMEQYEQSILIARDIMSDETEAIALRKFSTEYGGTAGRFGVGENALRGFLQRAIAESRIPSEKRDARGGKTGTFLLPIKIEALASLSPCGG